jgi:hypothetical protein
MNEATLGAMDMEQAVDGEVSDMEVAQREDKLQQLGFRLQRLATERIRQRQPVEERWLEDLEQYLGQYDATTLSELNKDPARSKVFVNITRPKTNAAESRLAEMLFPSDDRNWAIQPTPVPELQAAVQDETEVDDKGTTVSDQAHEQMELARKKAERMQSEIDDQLAEAAYNAKARDAIHDACVYGTGILKGPIVLNRTQKQWTEIPGTNVHVLDIQKNMRPGIEKVDVWDFFPDMAAREVEECDSILERKYLTKKQLRSLAKRQGYMKGKIRQAIEAGPTNSLTGSSTHIAKLRELSGQSVDINDKRFELWEYQGPIDKDDLRACGCEPSDDELEEIDGIVLFVGNIVIKADLNPLDTQEFNYSCFIYERDDSSLFGFGVPYLVRNPQRMVNGAIRTMLENAGLSSGPQIVVNREMIEPADGIWTLSARKIWFSKGMNARVRDVFDAFEINSHQPELMGLFQLAQSLADDVTALPMLAQGEKGDAPETATGMSMLMNSANTVLKRAVKQFDDKVTRPLIQRFYDWNMQYSEKADIKGDYTIEPRGSSALLVKETQTAGLLKTMEYATHPTWTPLTKLAGLYRKAIESQRLNPDEIVKDDEEVEKDAQRQAESQQAAMQMEQEKLKTQLAKLEAEIMKINAEATAKNIEALYSSTQAAGIVAGNPVLAQAADEISQSAGFVDHNAPPIIPQQTQTPIAAPVNVRQNTSPMFPPRPQQADAGMMGGIETSNPAG